ncbi:MAG: hypothetical protein IT182_10405 [Acidobacteria bacterium]|nr:hypothetical protein [Acidobacteriota bacterium]
MLLIDRVLSVLALPTPAMPLLIGGCGAGRTHALHAVVARLAADTTPVYLDVERIATTPEQCYRSLLRTVRVADEGDVLPAPASLTSPRAAFDAILALLTTARAASGRRFTFLLDEVLDLRTFESFPGLRSLMAETGTAVSTSPNRFVLATRFAQRGARLAKSWPGITSLSLDDAGNEADGRAASAFGGLDPLEEQQVLALTGGRLGYAVMVSDALKQARRHGLADPVGALTEQMLPGSALERRLRLSYEVRLQRARGYGALRAILDILAEQEPLTLTLIAQRLHRTPGSTKDYLSWLLDVDLLRVERKRYTYADPLLRLWVRLNNGADVPGDGTVARETQRHAIDRLSKMPAAAVAVSRPASPSGGIIEID